MSNIITKIFGGGAKEVVGAVGSVLDNLITNKEELAKAKLEAEKEINRHYEAIQANATKHIELEIQDKDSARRREAEFVKATGHIDWMQTAVGVIVLLTFIGALILIGFKQIPEGSEHLMINAIGIMEGMVLSVVGYYFGSSAGSRIKDMKK